MCARWRCARCLCARWRGGHCRCDGVPRWRSRDRARPARGGDDDFDDGDVGAEGGESAGTVRAVSGSIAWPFISGVPMSRLLRLAGGRRERCRASDTWASGPGTDAAEPVSSETAPVAAFPRLTSIGPLTAGVAHWSDVTHSLVVGLSRSARSRRAGWWELAGANAAGLAHGRRGGGITLSGLIGSVVG